MRLRKAIKKIAALGVSAAFVGATILGAASAATLADYPSPFVGAGKFTGVMVVGDKAAAEDVIGVTDIATSLQYASSVAAGSAGGVTVSVEGDAWRVGTSSKKLEMAPNNKSTAQGAGEFESIKDIQNNIEEDELDALADGEVINDKGTAGYNQYLDFKESATAYVKLLESDDDEVADFLYIEDGDQIAKYHLEFKASFQSDVEDSNGDSTTVGTYLSDYEDETLTMVGKEYEIVKARRATTVSTGNVELTLMGGAVKDTLQEGETKTYTVNGIDYEVTVLVITDLSTNNKVKFSVNGESTDALMDGQTHRLSDGSQIGVAELLPNEAGDVSQDLVTFYVGADKLVLKDTDISAIGQGEQTLEAGSEKIDGTTVIIDGTNSTSSSALISIDNIYLNVTADEDLFVPAGGKVSEYMDEPQGLLSWDISYEGLEDVGTEMIEIETSGSRKYDLRFRDGNGNDVSLPLAYAVTATTLKTGDNDDELIMNETHIISKNDYFIVADENGQDAGREVAYALRYKGADKSSGDNPVIKFDLLGEGSIERTYKEQGGTTADASLKLGGATFKIENHTASIASNFDIKVDLDSSGTIGTNIIDVETSAGARIAIDNSSANYMVLTISTPNTNDYDNFKPTDLQYNISPTTGNEVRLAQLDGYALVSPDDEDDTSYGYTTMGAKITYNAPSSNPQTLDIGYPSEQRLPMVFVTAGVTTISSASASGEAVTIQKIEVGATKLASEVTDIAAQNVIAVGGPCANAVAAEAMGNPADCTAGFEAGKGMLELFDTGAGNVALVVAGYSAMDTRNTAQVLANFGDYELIGTKMEVSKVGTTLNVAEAAEVEAPVADAE